MSHKDTKALSLNAIKEEIEISFELLLGEYYSQAEFSITNSSPLTSKERLCFEHLANLLRKSLLESIKVSK